MAKPLHKIPNIAFAGVYWLPVLLLNQLQGFISYKHTLLLLPQLDFSGTVTHNNIYNYNKTNENIQTVNMKIFLDLDLLYPYLSHREKLDCMGNF